jgi:hypothetical protein
MLRAEATALGGNKLDGRVLTYTFYPNGMELREYIWIWKTTKYSKMSITKPYSTHNFY